VQEQLRRAAAEAVAKHRAGQQQHHQGAGSAAEMAASPGYARPQLHPAATAAAPAGSDSQDDLAGYDPDSFDWDAFLNGDAEAADGEGQPEELAPGADQAGQAAAAANANGSAAAALHAAADAPSSGRSHKHSKHKKDKRHKKWVTLLCAWFLALDALASLLPAAPCAPPPKLVIMLCRSKRDKKRNSRSRSRSQSASRGKRRRSSQLLSEERAGSGQQEAALHPPDAGEDEAAWAAAAEFAAALAAGAVEAEQEPLADYNPAAYDWDAFLDDGDGAGTNALHA
jgi:hypothetical protein